MPLGRHRRVASLVRPAARSRRATAARARPGRHGRDRCGRFHDGIDIATPRGTRVHASAAGYVAYVGWNPWDRGRRAFVVIIGHARGIETVYAHLAPVRMVRAGQAVKRGQAIGVVGLTGHTTGAHVHWEVSRDFRSMDLTARPAGTDGGLTHRKRRGFDGQPVAALPDLPVEVRAEGAAGAAHVADELALLHDLALADQVAAAACARRASRCRRHGR